MKMKIYCSDRSTIN